MSVQPLNISPWQPPRVLTPSHLPRWAACLAFILLVALTSLLPGSLHAEDPVPGAEESAPAPFTSPDGGSRVLLPFIRSAVPASTGATYSLIPVLPPPTDRPAANHGDLNLSLRGYAQTGAPLALVDYGGATDLGAPQMPGIFADTRVPRFTSAYQVYNWNWGCGPDGCRGSLLQDYPVTLLGIETRPGELLAAPRRGAEIYGGGYTALVLYAESTRITLKYTREDNVVSGYTVHFERLNVDPNLLSLYQKANAAGRGQLPALKNGQPLGLASGGEVLVAIRDWGTFLDPRSRKDWWQGL
jgi:hypothetical protein